MADQAGAGYVPRREGSFNEDSLRADIVKVWGEHGAHIDVFDHMLTLAAYAKEALRG